MNFLWNVVVEIWMVTARMAPFLLLGFAVAGLLSVFVNPAWLERHLGGRGWRPVVKAALLGVPLPLCSCGVIPVAVSLRRHGAGRPATMSFLASTPQTGVDSVLATGALLGPLFAAVRVVTALFTGLLTGALVGLGPEPSKMKPSLPVPIEGRARRWQAGITYGLITLPRAIASSVLIGLVLAGLVSALVPAGALGAWVGVSWLGYLVALGLGVPLYVCSTGSIPLAFALMQGGLSPGAALVFLVSGPATNAATLTTSWKEFGPRATLSYLTALMFTALAAGVLLDWWSYSFPNQMMMGCLPHHLSWMYHASGLVLILLLGIAKWGRFGRKAPLGTPDLTLHVKGMTCDHCAQTVREALEAHAGVQVVVDRSADTACIYGSPIHASALIASLAEAGFDSVEAVQTVVKQPG